MGVINMVVSAGLATLSVNTVKLTIKNAKCLVLLKRILSVVVAGEIPSGLSQHLTQWRPESRKPRKSMSPLKESSKTSTRLEDILWLPTDLPNNWHGSLVET